MKRYILFGGWQGDPGGGLGDFVSSHDSSVWAERAGIYHMSEGDIHWYTVFDCELRVVTANVGDHHQGPEGFNQALELADQNAARTGDG